MLVAGIAAVALRDRGTDSSPATPGPDAPTPSGPAVDTTTSVPDTVEPGGEEGRPSVLVASAADGRLVALDPGTGAIRRVLAEGFDPPDAEVDGGPYVVADVAVDTARGRVRYGTCCEPAVGQIFSVNIDAGSPESFLIADRPTLSPDGRKLAVVRMQGW